MKRMVVALLVITVIIPSTLFAATSGDTQPAMVSESSPVAAPKPADKTSDYSPTAEKVYYRIGLGTLIAGGAFLVIGGIAADSDEMGSDAVSDVSFATGGGLLAISSAFWLLYFHENDKKPAATVGVELDKNRAVVQARFAF